MSLKDLLTDQEEKGTLVVLDASETVGDADAFMQKMRSIRNEYEMKSADSVRVLRDSMLK